MQVRNVSKHDLKNALSVINKRFDGNITIEIKSAEQFTLGVNDSRKAGGRLGRRTKSGARRVVPFKACWHVHGYFFEALFKINPATVILTPFGRITGPSSLEGNWRDAEVVGEPGTKFSELCRCKNLERKGLLIPAPRKPSLSKKGKRFKLPAKIMPQRPEGVWHFGGS